MANQDESTVRHGDNKEDAVESFKRLFVAAFGEDFRPPPSVGDGSDSASDDSEEGSDEGDVETPEQRAERLKEISETEVSTEYTSSPQYRVAVSEFDPDDTDPQPAEHWVYNDPEFEEHGNF